MNKTRTFVLCKLRFEATHCWPSCNIDEVAFLSAPHRHEFHVEATVAVNHDDRDVEFIRLKRQIAAYIAENVVEQTPTGPSIGTRSCEQVAKELLEAFGLTTCSVLEDGENGAVVARD